LPWDSRAFGPVAIGWIFLRIDTAIKPALSQERESDRPSHEDIDCELSYCHPVLQQEIPNNQALGGVLELDQLGNGRPALRGWEQPEL
jgi:hypothetical protein